jgi:hypothetical protein
MWLRHLAIRTYSSVLNERAPTDGHHVTICFTVRFHGYDPSPHPITCANCAALNTIPRHTQSPVLMTLSSLPSPASPNELKNLVEKKRHLKVCEENFWGMVLIKQMLDIISCEIWNVFCRQAQAFVCRARGRAGYGARRGVRSVLQQWHKRAVGATLWLLTSAPDNFTVRHCQMLQGHPPFSSWSAQHYESSLKPIK